MREGGGLPSSSAPHSPLEFDQVSEVAAKERSVALAARLALQLDRGRVQRRPDERPNSSVTRESCQQFRVLSPNDEVSIQEQEASLLELSNRMDCRTFLGTRVRALPVRISRHAGHGETLDQSPVHGAIVDPELASRSSSPCPRTGRVVNEIRIVAITEEHHLSGVTMRRPAPSARDPLVDPEDPGTDPRQRIATGCPLLS